MTQNRYDTMADMKAAMSALNQLLMKSEDKPKDAELILAIANQIFMSLFIELHLIRSAIEKIATATDAIGVESNALRIHIIDNADIDA